MRDPVHLCRAVDPREFLRRLLDKDLLLRVRQSDFGVWREEVTRREERASRVELESEAGSVRDVDRAAVRDRFVQEEVAKDGSDRLAVGRVGDVCRRRRSRQPCVSKAEEFTGQTHIRRTASGPDS